MMQRLSPRLLRSTYLSRNLPLSESAALCALQCHPPGGLPLPFQRTLASEVTSRGTRLRQQPSFEQQGRTSESFRTSKSSSSPRREQQEVSARTAAGGRGGGNNIARLCKENRLAEALQIFNQRPDAVGATTLITILGRQLQQQRQRQEQERDSSTAAAVTLDQAFRVYETLIAHGRPLDTVVICALAGLCRKCGEPGRAVPRLLDDTKRFGVALDSLTFHVLAAACGETGDRNAARALLAIAAAAAAQRSGPQGRQTLIPDATDYAQLIKALLARQSTDHATTDDEDSAAARKEALLIIETMEERGIAQSSSHAPALLIAACAESGDLDLGRRVHARIRHRVYDDSYVASALIALYSKEGGSLREAMEVYDTFVFGCGRSTTNRHHHPYRGLNASVLSAIVSACRRHREPGRALPRILADIDRFGVALDQPTFQVMASACAESGDAASAKRLLAKLKSLSGFRADAIACGQLVKALLSGVVATTSSVDGRLGVPVVIPQGQDSTRDGDNRGGYHDSDHPRSRANDSEVYERSPLEEALSVLDEMDRQGITPTSHIPALILAACTESGNVELGRRLHDRIFGRQRIYSGSTPLIDDFTGAGLISMYSGCGFLSDASAVFEDIRHQYPRALGLSTCNAMLSAYGQHGHATEALALFEEMVASTRAQHHGQLRQTLDDDDDDDNDETKVQLLPRPDEVSLVAVLNACSHSGRVDEAKAIFDDLVAGQYGLVPTTIQHQNCLVDALGRAGRLAEAEQFIHTRISQPDVITWSTLLGACRNKGDIARAERAAKKLVELAPGHAAARVLLGNTYASSGLWADEKRVRKEMKDGGIKKIPGMSWIIHDNVRHVFTVEDKRHPRIKDIVAQLDAQDKWMREAGFKPNRSAVTASWLVDSDNDAKDRHLLQHSERLAINYGLLVTPPGTTLRVFENLRVCQNCHEAMKFIARKEQREIILRDANRFHHFSTDGRCSCCDYW